MTPRRRPVFKERPPCLCIDFDGVIHVYPSNWRERVEAGESTLQDVPVPGAFDSLRQLRARGYVLVICTARKGLKAVRKWIADHAPDLAEIEVTGRKPGAIAYVDDRAVRFDGLWTEILEKFPPVMPPSPARQTNSEDPHRTGSGPSRDDGRGEKS